MKSEIHENRELFFSMAWVSRISASLDLVTNIRLWRCMRPVSSRGVDQLDRWEVWQEQLKPGLATSPARNPTIGSLEMRLISSVLEIDS